jgi:hypothetical protein
LTPRIFNVAAIKRKNVADILPYRAVAVCRATRHYLAGARPCHREKIYIVTNYSHAAPP